MTDDLYRQLINSGAGKKVFRRKKKHQGADWTPDDASALSGDGPWCASCRQRHGYMSKLMGTQYEKRNGVWYILWVCKKTSNVIKDHALGT